MIYSKDNLRQIFQKPFNMSEWQQILRHFFQAKDLKVEPEAINGTSDDEKGYYLGALDTTDSYRIGLFCYKIQHGNVARKRVGLRNLVKSFVNPNWGEFDAALVVFDSGELWRLSFVSDIKGESTAPKRYTYVFGESDSFYNTPVGRFDALQRKGISFENIKDAFSVEALSKEFFDEYREHYADIVEYITGKRYVKEKGKWVEKTIHEPCHEIFDQFVAVYKDPEKTVRDYIKKLMGRLVFLQFLQKKEWMGVPANRQDWKGGDIRFLQNKFNEFADKDNFIDGFLEPLFNDLNTNRQNNNDIASIKVGSDIKIPFLNGGLFQLDEEDCSNIRLPQHLLGDVLDFFERYNFTIDENDPNDAQIGVDPEMLGRVFENLLEDNKDKGAFYTPKEIVQYMCQESLIAYLQTGIDDESHKESIRQFVLTHESEHLGSMAEDISIKLLNVKICDPAIGSGAFPMGLLRQLYLCQCAIHPELEEKDAADIKRHIIQNNIYGVDIEKGAVDIARLRFWLSLIVDEETPRFLPNLDFKIMQGNSLLEQYKGVDLSKMTTLSTEQGEGTQLTWFDKELDILRFGLREKLNEYYNCSNHQRKEQLKQEIIDNVKQQLREQSINVNFGDLDLSANDQFTLWHTWFYDVFSQGGFDIVIGNPPYLRIQGIRESNPTFADYLSNNYTSATGSFDLYVIFAEKGLNLINPKGVVNYIMPTKWTNSAFGKGLRKLVSKTKSASKIINFGAYQVFNASTYTGLHWFMPNSDYLKYIELDRDLSTNDELKQYLDSLKHEHSTIINSEKLNECQWILTNNAIFEILNRLEQHPRRIKDVFDKIFQGLATSKDDVYFIYDCSVDEEFITGESKQLGRIVQIEKGLVKPLLKGEDVHRYDTIKTDRYVVFPYKIQNGKAILYSESVLSKLFPQGYAYLKECESVLREREKGRFNIDGEWFQFGRKQGILFAEKEKLVAPDISMGGNFAYDCKGEFYQTTTIYGYIKRQDVQENYKFWLALLNSRLCWWFMANTGTVLANGFFRYKPDYINPFPVPQSISKEAEKAITILVDYIIAIKSLPKEVMVDEYVEKDAIIRQFENVIDALLYELYFAVEFKQVDISFVAPVLSSFAPIDSKNNQETVNIIRNSFALFRNMNNEIRNNLKYMSVKLESLLAPIINI